MAKKMLSKPMMPNLGPSQPGVQTDWPAGQTKPLPLKPPPLPLRPLSGAHGVSSDSPAKSQSSDTTRCTRRNTQFLRIYLNISGKGRKPLTCR